MNNKVKYGSNNNMFDIQFKFNPETGELVSEEERTSEIFGYNSKFEYNNLKIYVNENNVFGYVKAVCPRCGKANVIKYGIRRMEKYNKYGLAFTYKIQVYYCKSCNHKFSTQADYFVKKNNKFIRDIKYKISSLYRLGYDTLRKIAKKINITMGIKLSHQSVRNWFVESCKEEKDITQDESLIINHKMDLSGYYVYDEEYIKLKGKRHYRLLLFDHKNYIPVAEQIVEKLESQTIYDFIKRSTKNKPLISITTDAKKSYFKIMKKLKVKHQLCQFHFMKNISDIIRKNNYKKKYTKEKYQHIIEQTNRLKNIFKLKSLNEIEEELKYFKRISGTLPKHINKYIENHFIKYLNHYLIHRTDENIPKTSNNAENYFRQTDAHTTKKIYKTTEGILLHLTHKMQYWTTKHAKN